MAISFPENLDTLVNPSSTDTLDSPSHSGQHADVNDAVEALEAKVGVDDSAVTSSHDYKIGALELLATADGWIDANETWTYDSVDDPTGVFTVSADVTDKYSDGMRIKMTNGGNTIYGIITDVSESGGTTTIKFLHEINPADSEALNLMADSAITSPYYSTQKAPQGFPLDPSKWTVEKKSTNLATETTTLSATFYNVDGTNGQLSVPIGSWDLSWRAHGRIKVNTPSYQHYKATLTSTDGSVSNDNLTASFRAAPVAVASGYIGFSMGANDNVVLTSKTLYYLECARVGAQSVVSVGFDGTSVPSIIRATCAYL
jgi:hypothetical protein